MPDYGVYRLGAGEWLRYGAAGLGLAALTAYVFYRSWISFILLSPLAVCFPLYQRRLLKEERQDRLRSQFKDGILSLASALKAGYAVENAFHAAVRDLRDIYGKEEMITREFTYIAEQLRMNRTAEALLADFALRSHVQEIRSFSELFAVAKRSRGGLVDIISHVAEVIGEQIRMAEDIRTLTTEKRLEQKIMEMIPFGIVLYVDLTSPGFFAQMYHTAAGKVVMSVCLAVYMLSVWLAHHFLAITL